MANGSIGASIVQERQFRAGKGDRVGAILAEISRSAQSEFDKASLRRMNSNTSFQSGSVSDSTICLQAMPAITDL
jgi:hypothetical protein